MAKKNNGGSQGGRIRKADLPVLIIDFLTRQQKQSFNYKQIAFGIGGHESGQPDGCDQCA